MLASNPVAAIAFGLACAIVMTVFIAAALVEDDDGPGGAGRA